MPSATVHSLPDLRVIVKSNQPAGARKLVAVVAVEHIVEIDGALDNKVQVTRLVFSKIFSNGAVESAQGSPDDIARWLEAHGFCQVGARTGAGEIGVVWFSPLAPVDITLAEIGQYLNENLTGCTVMFHYTDSLSRAHLGTSRSKDQIRRARARDPYKSRDLGLVTTGVV